MPQVKHKAPARKTLPCYLVVREAARSPNRNVKLVYLPQGAGATAFIVSAYAPSTSEVIGRTRKAILDGVRSREPGTYHGVVTLGTSWGKRYLPPVIKVGRVVKSTADEIKRLERRGVAGRTLADTLRRAAFLPLPPGLSGEPAPTEGVPADHRFWLYAGTITPQRVGWVAHYDDAAVWARRNDGYLYDRERGIWGKPTASPEDA